MFYPDSGSAGWNAALVCWRRTNTPGLSSFLSVTLGQSCHTMGRRDGMSTLGVASIRLHPELALALAGGGKEGIK